MLKTHGLKIWHQCVVTDVLMRLLFKLLGLISTLYRWSPNPRPSESKSLGTGAYQCSPPGWILSSEPRLVTGSAFGNHCWTGSSVKSLRVKNFCVWGGGRGNISLTCGSHWFHLYKLLCDQWMEMEGQRLPCRVHCVVCESDTGIYDRQPEKTHFVLLREVTGTKISARRWEKSEYWLLCRESKWLGWVKMI